MVSRAGTAPGWLRYRITSTLPKKNEGKRPTGPDADWAHLPDPVADAIGSLSRRVAKT